MFDNLCLVAIKQGDNNVYHPTGRKSNGLVTIEHDISKQAFYSKDDAIILIDSLKEAGIEAKVISVDSYFDLLTA